MARVWESIIPYEDRSCVTTSRWRLAGVRTKEAGENTDSGVLWAVLTKSGDTLTANVYKDDGLASGNKVMTGTADVSTVTGQADDAVEVSLTAENSSGLSGSFWVHDWESTPPTIPLQVALCTDEDLDQLFDQIDALAGYDSTAGCAEFIRTAGEEVLTLVMGMYQEHLGGHGEQEAWFITDAARLYPDLRRLANPRALRKPTACRALAMMLGRSHADGASTMYSELRDYFHGQFAEAMASLTLPIKTGSGDDALATADAAVVYQSRA